MELLHERCAALDIGKKDLKACVRTPSPKGKRSRRQEIRTFATTTNALLELRDWLVAEQVSLVVVEATGDYWRGAFYLLEDQLNVILVNSAHAKGLPGRKTDVCDAAWLCQLGECGLLRASFVPPEPIRQLRDLTRYRTTLTAERSREAQRLEKELEDAGIKLSSVATDITGVSGRAMLAALIDGERDPQVLAEMAKTRMRPKIPHLVQALTGNFGEHHAFLCRLHLQRIDELTAAIAELSARIAEQMRPFARQLEHLMTIPGVGQTGGRGDRRRDRYRHGPLPHRCELGVLGRGMPGASRIGRQTQIGQDPSRRPVADRRTGHRRDGRGPHQRHHLSRGTLPTPRPSAWEKESPCRDRTLDPGRGVAHAHQQRRLPRSRRRLLRPARSRTRHAPHHPPGQLLGLHGALRPHPGRLTTHTTSTQRQTKSPGGAHLTSFSDQTETTSRSLPARFCRR